MLQRIRTLKHQTQKGHKANPQLLIFRPRIVPISKHAEEELDIKKSDNVEAVIKSIEVIIAKER